MNTDIATTITDKISARYQINAAVLIDILSNDYDYDWNEVEATLAELTNSKTISKNGKTYVMGDVEYARSAKGEKKLAAERKAAKDAAIARRKAQATKAGMIRVVTYGGGKKHKPCKTFGNCSSMTPTPHCYECGTGRYA